MNIVISDGIARIFGDHVTVKNNLPAKTYQVCFNKMSGFYLMSREDLEIKEEVYGNSKKKVSKVLQSFKATNRNLGVILSGQKGIGKSLFVKTLAKEALNVNIPILIVDTAIPGIADFISSIKQEVIVVFDEFEKTFAPLDGESPQEELLPLFDGIDNGKKIFIITCNETNKLNEYFLNRPGRFHYHFILNSPTPEEIKQYLMDKLEVKYHNLIEKITSLSFVTDITYDILRAICFDVNQGYSLQEVIEDLNIFKEGDNDYYLEIKMNDGEIYQSRDIWLDLYSNTVVSYGIEPIQHGIRYAALGISFIPSTFKVINNQIQYNVSNVDIKLDEDEYYRFDKSEVKTQMALDSKKKPVSVILRRSNKSKYQNIVV